jgi:hypothetical protein
MVFKRGLDSRLRSDRLRKAGVALIAASLAFFFLPVVYIANLFPCGGGDTLCMINPSGLVSLGYWFFHQGISYMFEPGGNNWGFGTIGFGFDTPFGVLITYIFPLVVVCVALLAPEIVALSRITRASFVAFGLLVVAYSALFVLTLTLPLAAFGVVLVFTGWYMVTFGMRIWIFQVENLPLEEEHLIGKFSASDES